MIGRRSMIRLLGGAAAWPGAVHAQQPMLPVVGYLGSDVEEKHAPQFSALHQGLAEAGYTEGRNVTIDYRWSAGHVERFPDLAADLVRNRVTVIAALAGIPAATAAKAATTTIPIVFQGGFDPVELGLVASLNRPGGNVTGVSNLGLELGPKRLEVMHELLPAAKVLALLLNPDHPNAASQTREMEAAAQALGLKILLVPARALGEFDAAFAAAARLGAAGIVVGFGQPFTARARDLGAVAARHAIPAISESHEFVAGGGLMSYSGSREEAFRVAGLYLGRILKGESPADLPVQQATKVELIVNLRAAKALGITVPLALLGRADEVIE